MRVPTRHPRLSTVACKIYSWTICVYPTEFRRAFGHELVVTFRNRVEDVLDGGGIVEWLSFAGHVAIDCVRTCATLLTESRACRSMSLLGLSDDDLSHAGIDRTATGMSHVFVAAGVVFSAGVWYMLSSQVPDGEARRVGITACGTGQSVMPAQCRLKVTFWLDVALLVSICVLQTVSFTGLVLHEWLGVATVGMVLAHLLLAWGWIATQSRRFVARQSARERINYLINLSLFALVTAVIFSGIVISQKAIPTLTGTNAAPQLDWHWDVLHNRFSEAVVLLSAFHLAINWEWVLAAGQRLLFPSVENIRGRLRWFREGAP